MAKEIKVPVLNKGVEVTAYCMKCKKKKRKMKNPKVVQAGKSNRLMIQGKHKKCGTKMSLMTSADRIKEYNKAA
jgi:hypothetical protein